MLKRTITGACYVAVLTAFFLLRQYVAPWTFAILIGLFCFIGTFEVANAFRDRLVKSGYILALIYGLIFVPLYCIGQYVVLPEIDGGWIFAVDLFALFAIIISVVTMVTNADVSSFWPSILPFVYPALLLLTMLMANDLKFGFSALLLGFVVSPVSDTFAYLTGSLIGGKKLCPKLSPKKTWAGAIGGTVGGIISAIIVWAIVRPEINFFSPVFFFIIVGFIASIVNIFGDLFESFLKRKANIKDMGIILPGHGGVMDRIDGTSLAMVVIFISFLFV